MGYREINRARKKGNDSCSHFLSTIPAATFCLVALLLGLSISVQAADYYVSPTGSSSGDGSINNPWDLYTAFNLGAVNAGDTIWLRGGVYWPRESSWESLECYLLGTANAPIIVRNYPGEHVILQNHPQYNGGSVPYVLLMKTGGYVWFWGLELRCTNTTKVINESGSNPSYSVLPLPSAVDISAPGVKLINLIIHDTRGGPGPKIGAVNAEVYSCIIYNNGWVGPDRGHGHGIYCQNLNGVMHLSDNIIFNQFGLGIHGYTEGGSFLKHFLVERNIVFNNSRIGQYPDDPKEQILFGGGSPIQDLKLFNNHVYLPLGISSTPLRLDYAASSNDDLVVANNYVAGDTDRSGVPYAVSAQQYQSLIFTNNLLYASNGGMLQLNSKPGYIVNYNTYYGNNNANFNNNGGQYNFAGWQAAGFDLNSSYLVNSVPPNKVIVNRNVYEPKRANIIVYNWGNSNTVSVDASSVLSSGDTYEVRNAQDYFAPLVLSGTYNGSPLILPMTNLTVAAPTGWTDTNSVPTTGKQFNVFVLLGAASSSNQSFRITSIVRSGNNMNLVWNGLAGSNVVQVSSGTADGGYSTNFANLATVILSTAGVTNYTDVGAATNASRFYRINLRQ